MPPPSTTSTSPTPSSACSPTRRCAGSPVELSALWDTAGRPRGKSPKQWHRRYRRRFEGQVEERDGRLLADDDAGLHYVQILEHDVERACAAAFARKLRANVARQMTGCPNPLMAVFAKGVLMERGVEGAEADQYLVAGAVEQTEGMGEMERETAVAKVQRAVAGVKVVRADGDEGRG